MSTTPHTTAERTGGHALHAGCGVIFIELRVTAVPAEDTYSSTAVLRYGEDSSHEYTYRTEQNRTEQSSNHILREVDHRNFPRHSSPSGRSAVWSGTKHSSRAAQGLVFIPTARRVLLIGCVCSRSSSSSKSVMLSIHLSGAAPERGFVLIRRREWAVNRAVAAQLAVSVVTRRFWPLHLERPPYSYRLL